jgi:hypothetical protein
MMKSVLGALCVSLGLGLAAVGCGDDDEDDDVKIKAPGVDISAEKLTGPDSAAAGSAATSEAK